ncbi:MAG TPA: hypothetical protein PK876_03155 [Elusimicrobiota bacterium]|nr:hypothetical protein [Elusimicrobiota bacterium]
MNDKMIRLTREGFVSPVSQDRDLAVRLLNRSTRDWAAAQSLRKDPEALLHCVGVMGFRLGWGLMALRGYRPTGRDPERAVHEAVSGWLVTETAFLTGDYAPLLQSWRTNLYEPDMPNEYLSALSPSAVSKKILSVGRRYREAIRRFIGENHPEFTPVLNGRTRGSTDLSAERTFRG